MSSHARLRAAVLSAAFALAAGGCSEAPPPAPEVAELPDLRREKLPKPVIKDLIELRRSLLEYRSFERAMQDSFNTKLTECMVMPPLGGMGFHYGNVGLIDGSVRVDEPELLLYEPEKNGQLRLVAVEYIIPYTFHPRSAEAPVLFGQRFEQIDMFELWGLHAWVWKENPSGIFASWNPRVTCENATEAMTMAH